jgi:predicted amidohydrolase
MLRPVLLCVYGAVQFAAAPWAAAAAQAALLPAAVLPISHSGCRVWSPRPEIAPRTFIDETRYRSKPDSLALSGNSNAAVFGGWQCDSPAVQSGKWYRLVAYYRTEGAIHDQLQIVPRLDWRRADGRRAGQPEYAFRTRPDGDWKRVEVEAPAPERAATVRIQLFVQNAPHATVWWDDISLEEIPAPSPRPVTVAAVNLKPRDTGSAEEAVRRFVKTVDTAVKKADIIVLPEGITVVGTGKSYADVAETVPGPTTAVLGELARRKRSYIVAGIFEREGGAIYNTSVLVDREGRVAGKYRKVYLPREELEGGLTPGNSYPVFDTDFGKVGMLICWDVQYADPARALALAGAELLVMPIWGGNEELARARAIENRVFLASSGYNFPTQILDPDGKLLAQAADPQGSVAVSTIDLARRYADDWLGNMRGRFMKELRLDVPVAQPAAR